LEAFNEVNSCFLEICEESLVANGGEDSVKRRDTGFPCKPEVTGSMKEVKA